VWVHYATFLFDQGRAAETPALLQRALRTLPKRKHVKVTVKVAMLDYKHAQGSVERGRTVFEGLVQILPKRGDVWGVYLDMEHLVCKRTAGSNVGYLRHLYQRATALNRSSKKARALFKRFLAFERAYGDEDSQEQVKRLAQEFVNSKLAQGGGGATVRSETAPAAASDASDSD
jgi:rRNA biogenesis protein RRP5